MADENQLERAREELRRASDAADRPIQEQLDSIQEGIFEELDGRRTQDDPEPKVDRIAELLEKLKGLEEKAPEEVSRRIRRTREYCLAYQRQRTDSS